MRLFSHRKRYHDPTSECSLFDSLREWICSFLLDYLIPYFWPTLRRNSVHCCIRTWNNSSSPNSFITPNIKSTRYWWKHPKLTSYNWKSLISYHPRCWIRKCCVYPFLKYFSSTRLRPWILVPIWNVSDSKFFYYPSLAMQFAWLFRSGDIYLQRYGRLVVMNGNDVDVWAICNFWRRKIGPAIP